MDGPSSRVTPKGLQFLRDVRAGASGVPQARTDHYASLGLFVPVRHATAGTWRMAASTLGRCLEHVLHVALQIDTGVLSLGVPTHAARAVGVAQGFLE